ncbi:MAG: ATP-dependent DNA helicase RecG [Bacteroidales bacterium]|nr:ATP-dependent DNA helicase RecG [Bacteroidales bacterium]
MMIVDKNKEDFLKQSLEKLKGIGLIRAQTLAKELGLKTVEDLLWYFPYKHIDRSKILPVGSLKNENGYVQVRGQFYDFREVYSLNNKSRLEAIFFDNTGSVKIVWFSNYKWVLNKYRIGETYYLFGRISRFGDEAYIAHPEISTEEQFKHLPILGKFQPLYGTTERMKKQGMDSRFIMRIIQQLISMLPEQMEEVLPFHILKRLKLPSFPDAFKWVHFPESVEQYERAIKRFKFQEALAIQLRNEISLRERKKQPSSVVIHKAGKLFHLFYRYHLPFTLTRAQERVIKEIFTDLKSGFRMNRLLQGDVGSGKTIVALLVALIVIGNGWQVAMMVPTEILAQQHYERIKSLLELLPVNVSLLTSSTPKKERKLLLEGLKEGQIDFIVGTHALIEDVVNFKKLGLVIIDEQHRFGVVQRAKLQLKTTYSPHVLVMTATPIPRTLAMTLYGDLDLSVIDELPPGRKPIQTMHFTESFRYRAWDLMKREVLSGHQAYVVYPLIEENEKLDLIALEEGFEAIKREFSRFAIVVDMLHGRMKQKDKDTIMNQFREGKIHILVSTTVIEVGVDVSNATMMIIEHAERFGLAQLHQLRGRIGRGGEKSYCLLITPDQVGSEAMERIQVFLSTMDGFKIAEEDLKMRGMGEIEGTRQSGQHTFRFIEPIGDEKILFFAQRMAKFILQKDPMLETPSYVCLKELINRSFQGMYFSDIA